ncbi:hypothetical protein AVEN_229969-1 [Araneus ventricosus]|uniref:Uncharacterized protein n=1 Tax=Araneus ventricosus TaxID=182803 RepID=A0A4Y2BYX6_ARAVE|nr:hypothetical protein AVEN_229969-1 [Araneus ventricosus]
MWTGTTIALAWIKTPHERLNTYVSNHVKTINTMRPNYDWRHVNSANNPADFISRDTTATNLKNPTERRNVEIQSLSEGLDIKQSEIKNLAPFLDEDNILRVGGRLQKN